MSTTIDQRVVEMRFDNKNFENNVSHTMSTLDKLKQKLNLTGASKGLQEVDNAAKKVDMRGLGSSVDAVSAKFSAMQIVGTTALVNITNQAVNSAKRMASALTIDPIKTGFQEYETQINAVQTILANTSSKGTTIDEVNKALEELNKYADLTIYNFTEMTRNIGTFTAAGVDLDTSVNAIKGIANLAAVSGSTSQQASTAMYQLSQALASGTVKLMDWNSVVNAGMGGQVFQDALKETARVHGIAIDKMIEDEGSFRETLSEGWLTSEILTETLQKFTLTTEGLTEAQIEQNRAMLKAKGYTDAQIEEIFKLGQTATDAATKVKTFTQLWDVLKEAAQSGWSQTWKLIVGDYEEAKSLLTPLSEFFTNAINKMSDARNALIEGALGKSFKSLVEKVQNIVDPIKKSADSITSVVKSVEDYAAVVDEIIGGKYGNGQKRWDALTEAGFDWAHAQNLVNEQLGCSVRHATNYAEAQGKVSDATENSAEATSSMTDAMAKQIAELAVLDEAQLRELNYTEEQIAAFKELERVARKTGIPLEEFLKNIDQIDGKWLLVNSFKNAGQAIVSVFQSIGKAWRDIFPAMQSDQLFDIIAGFHNFTVKLKTIEDESQNITRTFKGLFAIVDLVATVIGGGFKIAFNIISEILSYFGWSILDVTAAIGDVVVAFSEWLKNLVDIHAILDIVVPFIKQCASAVKDWFAGFREIEGVERVITLFNYLLTSIKRLDFSSDNPFKYVIQNVKNLFSSLKDVDLSAVGMHIIDGLTLGLGKGIVNVVQKIIEVGKEIVTNFCEQLGIHSPSTVFMAIGGFIIAGLLVGLKEGIVEVPEMFQGIVNKCIEIFNAIDWGTVFAVGVSVTALAFIKKIGDAIEAFSAPFSGLGDILDNVAEAVESFGKVSKAISLNLKAKALKQLAISLAIMVASVLAITLLVDDPVMLWNAVGVIGAMVVALGALALAMNYMGDASIKFEKGKGISFDGFKQNLLALGAAVLMLAVTAAILGKMDNAELEQGIVGAGLLIAALLGFTYALQAFTKGVVSENISKVGGLMIKLAIAMALMVVVVKLIGKLDENQIKKGSGFAIAFLAFTATLGLISKNAGQYVSKVGGLMIKLAIAMALMVGVVKLVGLLKVGEMIKGALFMQAFGLFVKALVNSTKMGYGVFAGPSGVSGAGESVGKIGGMLLGVTAAMVLMVGVCKLVGKLDSNEMVKGAVFAGAFLIFVKALISVTKIGSEEKIAKVSGMIFMMAVAIGVLALVTTMLSLLSWEQLAKGLAGITVLSALMMGMLWAARGVQDFKGTMIALIVGIGLLAAIMAALTLIKDPKKLIAPVVALGTLLVTFGYVIRSMSKITPQKGMLKSLIMMTVMTIVLAGVVAGLSFIPNPDAALKNTIALSLLMAAMTGMLAAVSAVGKYLNGGIVKGIAGLSAMIIPLALFVTALYFMPDISNSKDKITALTSLMLSMTVLLAAASVIGKYMSGGMVKGIVGLSAMVIPLMIFVAALHFMPDFANARDKITSLTTLMTVMTALLPIVSVVGKYLGGGLVKGIAGLTGMVIPLAAFAAALHFMPELGNAREKITALTSLMVAMTILLPIVSIVGRFCKGGMVAGIAGLSAMAIPLFLFASIIGRMDPIDAGVTNSILALTQVMIVMTVLLAAVSLVGQFLAAGIIPGILGLVAFIGVMGILVAAVGWLVDTFPQIQTWVDKGIPLLIQLAGGIGDMIGAFIGHIGEQLSGSLVKMGEDIADFMAHLATASSNAEGIKAESFDGVIGLIKALGGIAAVAAGMSIADLFMPLFGEATTMDAFKKDALAFFKAMKEIAPKMAECKIPADFSADGIISMITAMKKVGSYAVSSQWADLFTFGGTALEKFKKDAVAFFEAFKDVGDEAVQITFPDDFSVPGLTALLDVLKEVSTSMKGISIADIFSKIVGDEGAMEKFKTDGRNFFKAMHSIATSMKFFPARLPEDFSVPGLTALLDVLKEVSTSMKGISIADIFSKIVGDEGAMEKFKTDGRNFFKALHTVATSMKFFPARLPEDFKVEGLVALLDAFKTIGDYSLGSSWKEAFSWVSGADDKTGIAKFKEDATAFFETFKEMSTLASEIKIDSFSNASTAIDKIKEIVASVKGIDYSGVSEFTGIGTGGIGADGPMHDIAVAIKDFGKQISGVDVEAMATAVTAVGKIRTFISKLSGLDTSGIADFKDAVEELGKISFKKVVDAFKTADTALTQAGIDLIDGLIAGVKSSQGSIILAITAVLNGLSNTIRDKESVFNTAGGTLMTQFVTGVSSKTQAVKNALLVMISDSINSSRVYYSSFYSAGSYLVDGFAAGISANSYKAAAKASAMASAAVAAAQAALGINSPSKVFYQIGEYTGQGLINALSDYGSKVYNAGSDMADSARSGLADAIGKVKDIINGEVDMQPTIRPVLDLSNVQAGAGAINGMFGSSVGVMANIGAINRGMTSNQNGVNDDVVTAINALRKDLSNVGNTTYSINGVTYDDGSNISDAVKSLVRAAKVERRI